jgi:hypothetical protein
MWPSLVIPHGLVPKVHDAGISWITVYVRAFCSAKALAGESTEFLRACFFGKTSKVHRLVRQLQVLSKNWK